MSIFDTITNTAKTQLTEQGFRRNPNTVQLQKDAPTRLRILISKNDLDMYNMHTFFGQDEHKASSYNLVCPNQINNIPENKSICPCCLEYPEVVNLTGKYKTKPYVIFPVYDYITGRTLIMPIPIGKKIMNQLNEAIQSKNINELFEQDIIVKKVGSGFTSDIACSITQPTPLQATMKVLNKTEYNKLLKQAYKEEFEIVKGLI